MACIQQDRRLWMAQLQAGPGPQRHGVSVDQDAALTAHQDEIDNLKLLIPKLWRMQFGWRSEMLYPQIE